MPELDVYNAVHLLLMFLPDLISEWWKCCLHIKIESRIVAKDDISWANIGTMFVTSLELSISFILGQVKSCCPFRRGK